MLPTNHVHTYKGLQFKLSFREKQASQNVITVIASYVDQAGTHSNESTITPEVYKTVKTNDQLKDELCEGCLSSGVVKSAGGGNG
jgi:hypothetical protein